MHPHPTTNLTSLLSRHPAPVPPPPHYLLPTNSPLLLPAVFGPAATTWFGLLQRHVRLPGRPNAEIVARVACDQGLFAPTFIGIFLSSMALLEGGSPSEKLAASYLPALQTNYLLWPAVQLINFKFVPLHHRVLCVNVVSIGWNCYLSFLNSGGGEGGGSKVLEEVEALTEKKKQEGVVKEGVVKAD
jgi:hypothetical protein